MLCEQFCARRRTAQNQYARASAHLEESKQSLNVPGPIKLEGIAESVLSSQDNFNTRSRSSESRFSREGVGEIELYAGH